MFTFTISPWTRGPHKELNTYTRIPTSPVSTRILAFTLDAKTKRAMRFELKQQEESNKCVACARASSWALSHPRGRLPSSPSPNPPPPTHAQEQTKEEARSLDVTREKCLSHCLCTNEELNVVK
ncbi:hypothetical protein MHYP_G00065100 [Metynnis hypsauchen]